MNVGFVGLGIMGRPMALNLIKRGHALHVWSRRPESVEPLLAAGAIRHDSAAEVAIACDVVLSMVSDAPDVEQVALGLNGVADGARDGLVFVDMSTIAPDAARSIAGRLRQRGIAMLDAPVSGGESGAISGTLSIMVGGEPQVFERVRPLFECMGTSITLVGGSGAGQVAKACNQIVTGMGVAAVAEAFSFARRSGVDPARVREALLGGFAYSKILDNHGKRMLDRNFTPGFKAWMHQKDLRIVMESAHRLGLALPGAAAVAQMFNAMVGSGLGEEDSVAILKLLERLSGIQ
jgi:2-hydroxy-3-oxopropionate reductase